MKEERWRKGGREGGKEKKRKWVRDETQGDMCIWKDGSSPLFSSRRILGILAYNILSLEPVKPVTLPGSS